MYCAIWLTCLFKTPFPRTILELGKIGHPVYCLLEMFLQFNCVHCLCWDSSLIPRELILCLGKSPAVIPWMTGAWLLSPQTWPPSKTRHRIQGKQLNYFILLRLFCVSTIHIPHLAKKGGCRCQSYIEQQNNIIFQKFLNTVTIKSKRTFFMNL